MRVCLAGAALGNANRGVQALASATVSSVESFYPAVRFSILDDGMGVRTVRRASRPDLELLGARVSRRYHRPESWTRVRVSQSLRSATNPVASRLSESVAVLDVSGGDSFTDLYGEHRFKQVLAPKLATLRAGRPLILLPQTYGPFSSSRARARAREVLSRTHVIYARDSMSRNYVLELLPPSRHELVRSGVDMAFALAVQTPAADIVARVRAMQEDAGPESLVGVNVSGLLVDCKAQSRFGLADDYLQTVVGLIRCLVSMDCMVLLVPHVSSAAGSWEGDDQAIAQVMSTLDPATRTRVSIVPGHLRAEELKWLIGQCSWFMGSRMHATIAALSSGVPALGFSYSDKAAGVFGSCGLGQHIVDGRLVGGSEAIELMLSDFQRRRATRQHLHQVMPAIVHQARHQVRDMLFTVVPAPTAMSSLEP